MAKDREDRLNHSGTGDYVPRHGLPSEGGDAGKKDGLEKPRKRMSPRVVDRLLLIIGIALLVVAGVLLFRFLYPYWQGDKGYDAAEQNMSVSQDDAASGLDYSLNIDWATLKAENPDIVAWIYIPDTEVNYPVVQSDDNAYYLTHVFDGSENKLGCIFLDYQSASDFSDLNSIIYGHNMRNGSMFHDIVSYGDPDFDAAHPYVYLATPDGVTHRLKVFAKFVASGSELLDQTSFTNEAEYRSFVQAILDRNEISTDVTADQVDHLYMLASCSYEFNDARTLVCAVEVDKFGNIVESDISDRFTSNMALSGGSTATTSDASGTGATTSTAANPAG